MTVDIFGWMLGLVCCVALGAGSAAAEERIRLWPPGAGTDAAGEAVMTFYPPAAGGNGTAVIVCPGGGYQSLALIHEGKQVADWLGSLGIAAFVLEYRHGSRHLHPEPLNDATRAIALVRSQASRFAIDPKKIGILGFSAGGHLASSAGTAFRAGDTRSADPAEQASSRPDFMILLYPVITLDGPPTHRGSRENLLGKSPEQALAQKLSTHNAVTDATPPAFLVHTSEDTAVPAENSILFYRALREHHVPAELHIYDKGIHGLGLGQPGTPFATWPAACAAWLKGLGFLPVKG